MKTIATMAMMLVVMLFAGFANAEFQVPAKQGAQVVQSASGIQVKSHTIKRGPSEVKKLERRLLGKKGAVTKLGNEMSAINAKFDNATSAIRSAKESAESADNTTGLVHNKLFGGEIDNKPVKGAIEVLKEGNVEVNTKLDKQAAATAGIGKVMTFLGASNVFLVILFLVAAVVLIVMYRRGAFSAPPVDLQPLEEGIARAESAATAAVRAANEAAAAASNAANAAHGTIDAVHERADLTDRKIDEVPGKTATMVKTLDPDPLVIDLPGKKALYHAPKSGIEKGFYTVLNIEDDDVEIDPAKMRRKIKSRRGEAIHSVTGTMLKYGSTLDAKTTSLIDHLIKHGNNEIGKIEIIVVP